VESMSTLVPCANGIVVPTTDIDDGLPQGIVGLVALTDELRPEISVSREMLRGMPWQFYSSFHLLLRRAAMATGRTLSNINDSIWIGKVGPYSLGQLLSDPLLQDELAWLAEAIFQGFCLLLRYYRNDALRSFLQFKTNCFPIGILQWRRLWQQSIRFSTIFG
jgi:hypothetical protein